MRLILRDDHRNPRPPTVMMTAPADRGWAAGRGAAKFGFN